MTLQNQFIQLSENINDILENISKDQIAKENASPGCFSRDIKLNIKTIILTLLSFCSNRQDSRLEIYLSLLVDQFKGQHEPCDSTFRKALKNISPEKIMNIALQWDQLISPFLPSCDHNQFNNIYLFDGSRVTVPNNKENIKKYGFHGGSKNVAPLFPKALLGCLFDLSNGFIKQARYDHSKVSEMVQMMDFVDNITRPSLFIADHGLYGAATAYLLDKLNHNFIFRLYSSSCSQIIKHADFKYDRAEISLPVKTTSKELKSRLPEGELKIKYTLIRKKNKKGKYLYVVTNLKHKSNREVFDLYKMRERVEVCFKFLKGYGGLEKIHTNTRTHMMECIFATLPLYYNIIQTYINQCTANELEIDVKKTPNRKIIWQYFFEFLRKPKLVCIETIGNFTRLIKKTLIPIRPDRSYARISKIALTIRNKWIKTSYKKLKQKFEKEQQYVNYSP